MGYTHYWTHTANYTKAEWEVIQTDLAAIIDQATKEGIPLANGAGDAGTRPEFEDGGRLLLNGVGEDSHETFTVSRQRPPKQSWQSRAGLDFCKTRRKPYDVVVTAMLCYLSSVAGKFDVASDGNGPDFLSGLALARRALPHLENQLDVPMGILENDRWCPPHVYNQSSNYAFRFCVDGKAYIVGKEGSYCFPNHREAAKWAQKHNDLLNPMGYFDKARHQRIARAQTRLFRNMISVASLFDRAQSPPAYVRLEQIEMPAAAYNFRDLLTEVA